MLGSAKAKNRRDEESEVGSQKSEVGSQKSEGGSQKSEIGGQKAEGGVRASVLKGMMSIGFRPTVDAKKRVIEVNIFDFDQEIYNERIRVYVKKYLRAEVKFNNLDELKKQIGQDKIESLKIL